MFPSVLLFAQNPDAEAAAAVGVMAILAGYFICILFVIAISLIPTIAMIVGMWKVFEKAGHPGWAAIVPYYNYYILNEIAGKDVMWFILTIIPCVQLVAIVVINMDVARNFGKDPAYGIGLALLPFIFFPLLGYSDAQYKYMRN